MWPANRLMAAAPARWGSLARCLGPPRPGSPALGAPNPRIHWMAGREAFLAWEQSVLARDGLRSEADAGRATSWPGTCTYCRSATAFHVHAGPMFEGRPNLREGLHCTRCGLSARQRLLHLALASTLDTGRGPSGAVLERHSRLFTALRYLDPDILGSEYHPRHGRPGRRCLSLRPGRLPLPRLSRHESITGLSYPDRSLGYLAHSDVLEHVEDSAAALRESRRVLAPGAATVFTVPFFARLDHTIVRGYSDPHGTRIDLQPAEYHGDGATGRGIYTWYNFGWSFFALLQATFTSVEIGAVHSPAHGLMASDSRQAWWTMLPLVFRCRA